MKAGEGDRRTVIGDGEVGGFEIEDWLLFPGADDQVEETSSAWALEGGCAEGWSAGADEREAGSEVGGGVVRAAWAWPAGAQSETRRPTEARQETIPRQRKAKQVQRRDMCVLFSIRTKPNRHHRGSAQHCSCEQPTILSEEAVHNKRVTLRESRL